VVFVADALGGWLVGQLAGAGRKNLLAGIDVVIEGDMPPGRWELREGDTVIDRGRLEEQ
jgi:hypothetical protein